jgi:hypothetical protein
MREEFARTILETPEHDEGDSNRAVATGTPV